MVHFHIKSLTLYILAYILNIRDEFAVVCPITNTSNKFPLHISLDYRTKTTGVILTEHMKCLDVISRNIQFVEKMQEDLLEKILAYVKAFF